VAQGRLAVCSSRAAQPAGLLDVTPSYEFNMLGPHCTRASLRPAVSTYHRYAFPVGANRGAHTVRWRVHGI